jgi:starvation-inducible outer membrane lipoprotein
MTNRAALLITTAAAVLTGCVAAPTVVEPMRWTVGKSLTEGLGITNQASTVGNNRVLAPLEQ